MAHWRLYYHIVWTTKDRLPLITEAIEPFVHRVIGSKAQAEGGRVYALDGMADHIHLVIALPPSQDLASLVQAIKGSSSHLLNHERGIPFKWQKGYGAFTVGPRGLDAAIEYVKGQKEHHAAGTLIDALEFTCEQNDDPKRPYLRFPVAEQ